MALPDPADHAPACPAPERGDVPRLALSFDPNRDASTVRVLVWEVCPHCTQATQYHEERLPWRTFHRTWRARAAVWVATWEHRYNLGGRGT